MPFSPQNPTGEPVMLTGEAELAAPPSRHSRRAQTPAASATPGKKKNDLFVPRLATIIVNQLRQDVPGQMDELGLLSFPLGEGWGHPHPLLPTQDRVMREQGGGMEDGSWWWEILASPAPLLAHTHTHTHTWISVTLSPVHA